ncbi:TniB family NTP-binding protein [Ferrovibrio terrae]|uniref:TniB family NTP-binding protein n=1 Tax=Ferrovibrio terrae TaxID=2594003 RepID=UPI003137CD09
MTQIDGSEDKQQEARLWAFRKVFVKDPTLQEILRGIKTLHQSGCGTTHAQCMGLFGPSGSGKTRLVRYYERTFMKSLRKTTYCEGDIEIEIKPLLFVECPARATVKGVAETLLTVLGDPRPSRGSQQEMTQRILHLLRVRRTSLIVMDEFQHLVARSSNAVAAYETADWIKSLLNENICPIVLVGTDPAAEILKVNEQLQRRNFASFRIMAYSVSTEAEMKVFQNMLSGLEKALGLPLPSCLADEDLARRLHIASDGLIGRVTGLLDRALLLAIERQENSISRQILRDVFSRTEGILPIQPNPFSPKALLAGNPVKPEDNSRRLRARGGRDGGSLGGKLSA